MIYDHIDSPIARKNLPGEFLRAFSRLAKDTPDGKIELIPGKLWINVSVATGREAEGRLWEVHREFADVQMVLDGEEFCMADHGEPHPEAGAYIAENDSQLLERGTGRETVFRLVPGMFLLIMPGEPHLPTILSDGFPAPHKKIVAKIHRSLLD